jgi:glucose/arabinose dehydrogenase
VTDPVFVTASPDDPARLFILDKKGYVRLVKDGALVETPFLDVSQKISVGGERGLLGLAFHPCYGDNGRLFVYYTAQGDGKLTIEEYKRGQSADAADPMPVALVASITHVNNGAQPQGNHNGGMLAFGKDGFLYAGTGDGGGGGDADGNAQNKSILLGKMLRFDVSGSAATPAGNYPDADPAIWDIGLRNPWRYSFDRATGEMYIGDVGQGAWEEIDIEAPGTGHVNYGWHVAEGTHCYNAGTCDTTGFVAPITDYPHANGDNCVIGGYVYRGSKIAALAGTYLYSDNGSSVVRALQAQGGALVNGPVEITVGGADLAAVGCFGEDQAGELYVCDTTGGRVYRLAP